MEEELTGSNDSLKLIQHASSLRTFASEDSLQQLPSSLFFCDRTKQRGEHEPKLWFGTAADGRDLRRLHDTGIVAVVDVAWEEAPAVLSRDLIYVRVPLVDGDENCSDSIRFVLSVVDNCLRHGMPTLVCCSAGLSRSPCICAYAASVFGGLAPQECLDRLAKERSIRANAGFWKSILEATVSSAEKRPTGG